ncbi:MAG: hypothetical protein ACRD2R_06460 [Terriglobales bacterium]
MKRVTGLGGVFFKCKDPKSLYAWYEKHLGLVREETGSSVIFPWRDSQDPSHQGMTVWSLFSADTKYLDPSRASFMINYRVENLDRLLEVLRLIRGARILNSDALPGSWIRKATALNSGSPRRGNDHRWAVFPEPFPKPDIIR